MDVNNKATINTHPAIAITVPMLPLPNCGKKVAAGTAALPFNALPYMNNPPFIKNHNYFNVFFFFSRGQSKKAGLNRRSSLLSVPFRVMYTVTQ